ncbi:MAG: hypothetical protein IH593_05115, partial [Bacteroidales bacterium]|nr:hypothetical protein [Bacteroidales bacterium]
MGKLVTGDDSQVKNIIRKLVKSKRYSDLTADELALLHDYAAIEADDSEDQPRTLLHWIWDNLIRFDKYASKFVMIYDLDNIDDLIMSYKGNGSTDLPDGASLCTLITRKELVNLTGDYIKQLKVDDLGKRDEILGALLLTGLAGLTEFENDLKRICTEKSGDSESSSIYFKDRYVATALMSLIMLESKELDDVVSRLVTHTEEYTTSVKLLYFDLFPGMVNDWEIKDYHDFLIDYDDALYYPNLTFMVLKNELQVVNNMVLDRFREDSAHYVWSVIGPAVFSFRNGQLLEEFINRGENTILYHLFNYALLHRESWIVEVIKKYTEDVSEEEPGPTLDVLKYMAVFTVGFLSKADDQWARSFFNDVRPSVRSAAILSCIGRKQLRDEISELAGSADPLT